VAGSAFGKGVYHTVKKGETIWRICQTYGVSTKEVSRVNRLKNSEKIRVGQKLYIPGRTKVRTVSSSSAKASKARANVKRKKSKIVKGRFAWPVRGTVISEFGVEGGTSQDGIDIKAKKGSPVKASATGEVVHVTDDMRVFGNVIILKHKGDFYTLYAHNDKNLVKSGDKVKKGEKIAMVGNSGDAESFKLHFELRDGRDVRNPILFLP
jgi:lipoprotein NlpD